MSVWISPALSARLYTRTSSIKPANHSGHTPFPPTRNTPVEGAKLPDTTVDDTNTPFTYNRKLAPSYVDAKCDHAFNANPAEPTAFCSAPNHNCPTGRPVL
jgi:hypothetical protein